MTTRRVVLGSVSVLSLLAANACSNVSSSPDQTSSRGFTRVAAVRFEAPFLYQKIQDTVGTDAEILAAVINRLNEKRQAAGEKPSELLWVSKDYKGLLDAVRNRDAEIGIGAIGIDESRRKLVDFSEPYTQLELVLVGNPRIKQISADKLAGLKIGIREGTAVGTWVRSQYADAEITPFQTLNESLLALRRGEIAGVIDDRAMAAYALDTVTGMKRLEILPGLLHTLDVGAAVAQGNTVLLKTLNDVIAEAKSNGDLDRWRAEQLGDRIALVESRYTKRVERERMAVAPRQLNLRVSKDKANSFDIYRMANLRFILRNDKSGKTYRTSKISFNKRTGYSRVSLPPGKYSLQLPKLFKTSLGEVLIKKDDSPKVSYGLRFKTGGVFLEPDSI